MLQLIYVPLGGSSSGGFSFRGVEVFGPSATCSGVLSKKVNRNQIQALQCGKMQLHNLSSGFKRKNAGKVRTMPAVYL